MKYICIKEYFTTSINEIVDITRCEKYLFYYFLHETRWLIREKNINKYFINLRSWKLKKLL